MRHALARGVALAVSSALGAACGAAPTAPRAPAFQPPMALTFGIDQHFAIAGGSLGLLVDAAAPFSNLRCLASTGDTVTTGFEQLDWGVYGWRARLEARTVGVTTLSCVADPNASGSTTISVRLTRPVTVEYVRAFVPALIHVNPTIGGGLEVHSNFRLADGAVQWPGHCLGEYLAWNAATQTLTCRADAFRSVAVDYVNAACVTDPAATGPGFEWGTISVNGARLTTAWSGSTRQRRCMLFTMRADGTISPPD